jgi:hypothetical protein
MMKGKGWIIATCVLAVALVLVICFYPRFTEIYRTDRERIFVALDKSDFVPIEDEPALAYSSETGIVYYFFGTYEPLRENLGWTVYMTPYISEHGYFCRYVNGRIVELNGND